MSLRIGLLSLFLMFSVLLFAQNGDVHQHETEDHDHHHAHEIGASVSPVYFINAKEFSLALHFHYTYTIPDTRFGIGLAYERILDEHKHNFIGLEGAFRPVHPLTLSFTPGISFEGEDPGQKEFAFHFETAYEFEVGKFHLGPVVELAYHPEDFHASLGLHLGFGF